MAVSIPRKKGKGIGFTANLNDIIRTKKRIRSIKAIAIDTAYKEFRIIVKDIKENSQLMVPYKTGDLQKSAYARVERRFLDVKAEVGYDERGKLGYALLRHEEPAKNYTTPGTTHRYLALAFMQYEDVVDGIVRKAYNKRLKMIGFKKTVEND
jgi:hypothetical protein